MPRVTLSDGRVVIPVSRLEGGVLALVTALYERWFPFIGQDLLDSWADQWFPAGAGETV